MRPPLFRSGPCPSPPPSPRAAAGVTGAPAGCCTVCLLYCLLASCSGGLGCWQGPDGRLACLPPVVHRVWFGGRLPACLAHLAPPHTLAWHSCSIDAPGLRGGATFRVRAAYDAQLAGRTPSPISGGSGGGLPPLGVTLDDGVLGSTRGRGRRPGHRRLNRSRSANELEDMLREAALEEQLGMELAERQAGSQAGSQAGGPEPSAESPWQVASSTATGGSVAAGGVNGGTPLSLRHGSAPVLSAVLLGGGGSTPAGANGSVSRAPMLSSPGSLPRRPFSTEPPRGLPPISPAFSAGSQQDESGSPPAPVPARDGGIPIRQAGCWSMRLVGAAEGEQRVQHACRHC